MYYVRIFNRQITSQKAYIALLNHPNISGQYIIKNHSNILYSVLQLCESSGYQGADYEEFYYIGRDAVFSSRNLPAFWRNALFPFLLLS